MRDRLSLGALLLIGLVMPLTSCSDNPSLTSIVISPNTYTAELGPCGSEQVQANYTATGYYTRPGHTAITKDLTDSVTWYSFDVQLVTVSSTGVAQVVTCATPGSTFQSSTQISASANGFHGDIIAYATFDEAEPPAATPSDITSLTVERAASSQNGAVQFTAIGKTANGTVVNLEHQPTWNSSNPQAVSIDAHTGVANVLGSDKATVLAFYKNPDGVTATGVASLNTAPRN